MEIPRPEHPRPDFERPNWLNLNGTWQFEIDRSCSGIERGYQSGKDLTQRIVVPFPPESQLSGIRGLDFMNCVWYRRKVAIPASWKGKRALVRFGAVDYETRVWVNGREVGRHIGGYTPFALDATRAIGDRGEAEIVVQALDDNRTGRQPCGKQSPKYESYGCVYTRVTGIWQTVWMEAVPNTYVEHLRVDSSLGSSVVRISVGLAGKVAEGTLRATVSKDGSEVAESKAEAVFPITMVAVDIPNRQAWSPEDPQLYDLSLELAFANEEVDAVRSYLGIRDIKVRGKKILLNGKKRFLRMVLDQGYYPDGIYTAPDDGALRRDILLSKEMGFDGARLHQKVFEPRFLYWSDVLGYLVAGEYADWGANLKDPSAREAIAHEWVEVVRRDVNHPALIFWTPFNERRFEIGDVDVIEFLRKMTRLTRTIDPSRPVIDTSGYVHVDTDIYDLHDYEQDPGKFASHYEKFGRTGSDGDLWGHFKDESSPYLGQPVMISEYGGTWWNPGAPADEKSWGYGARPLTENEFLERYRALTETLLRNPMISAFAYTQLYDIEQEVNGLHTYDRRPKFDPRTIRSINRQEASIERD